MNIKTNNLSAFVAIVILFSLSSNSSAQGSYYNNVEAQVAAGLDCMPLKQALHDLISANHTVRNYGDLYPFMCTYDIGANGVIIDRYKGTSNTCSGGSLPGNMNREHVLPKSWWGGSTTVTQYTDFHNLLPSDAITNQDKSGFPLGIVSSSLNGNYPYTTFPATNIGLDGAPCTNINSSTTFDDNVFEPDNGYKGDFARIFLYMAVRYQDEIVNQNWKGINPTTTSVFSNDILTIFEPCVLTMLLQWHNQDAPSTLEINRNNAIALASNQNNRNPFIDHPEYASLIWDSSCLPAVACAIEQLNACELTATSVITNSGTQATWACDGNGSYDINAYTASNNASEQWLVYGPINLTNATFANLVLDIDENYTGPPLEFLWNSVSGNPTNANWNTVTTAGNADVFGLNINYSAAAGNAAVYLGIKYTATGASGGTHEFTLSNISFESDNCCAAVDLSINFDNIPGQTSWNIYDANNNIVASGGGYGSQPAFSNVLESTCLADGCYTLEVNDALANGMCPFQSSAIGVSTFITPGTLISPGSIVGTLSLVATPGLCGSYNIKDANGTTLANGGGNFGGSQLNNFCLTNGLAPKLQNETLRSESLSLTIMPNPVKDILHIGFDDVVLNENARLELIDVTGRTIKAYDGADLADAGIKVNTHQLNSGCYFARLVLNDVVVTEKFIKE